MFDEREQKRQMQEEAISQFIRRLEEYDDKVAPSLRKRGYKCIHSIDRTVTFTFGEVTFRRKRWKKGSHWITPVDEILGLKQRSRLSEELLYLIVHLSTMMPYEKVIKVLELTCNISVSIGTIVKAIKYGYSLLKEKEDYRFFKEYSNHKKKVDIIYIEGDGVMVKVRDQTLLNKNMDLAHFVVHTGHIETTKNRLKLSDKKEFIHANNKEARKQVHDYLFNHFDITDQTILVTNSDGGHGYAPSVFEEFAKSLKIKRHEHFWDAYHVNKLIKDYYSRFAPELLDQVLTAIYKHKKKTLKLILDTTESLIDDTLVQEKFMTLRNLLLKNFRYTKPAKLRGLNQSVVGVMETQHRKVTYRMKKRGMYWTTWGAETMSQLILLAYEENLHDLFFGQWRIDYQQYIELEKNSVAKSNKEYDKHIPHVGTLSGKLHGLRLR